MNGFTLINRGTTAKELDELIFKLLDVLRKVA